MSLYKFKAFNLNGKKIQGRLSASDFEGAKLQLTKKGSVIISLNEISEKELKNSLSKKEIVNFFQELSALLKAGLPLYDSLLALCEKHQGKLHIMLLDICEQVKGGKFLSVALSAYPKSFDQITTCMIANSEKSGSLEKTLEEISTLLTKQLELKKQISSALLYPAILGCFSLVVLSTLFFFVIPSLSSLFEGRVLNPFTHFVVSFSKALYNSKERLIISILLIIAFLTPFFTTTWGKEKLLHITVRLPFFKALLLKSAIVRFCRSFSTLLIGGLSYVEGFKLAKKTVRHPPLAEVLEIAEKKLIEGKRLSFELKNTPLIPPLFFRMLSIAEDGGNTPYMLQHLASIYEGEITKTMLQITTILQPLMLLLLGLIIGFVVLCVLLPLTDVSSFLAGG